MRNVLFRGIPRELLRPEKLPTSTMSIAAGEVIFDEGDPPDYCYLVGSGAVRITKVLPGGRQELLATIQPGEFFGDLALYDSSPRSARATAAVPTRVRRLDQAAFETLRRAAPLQIAANLADSAIDRVRQTNERLVSELVAAGRLVEVGNDLGTLSHNLRSPLATIRNAADMLHEWLGGESPGPGRAERFVEIIRGTADKALIQIDQLMAHLRGEGGQERSRVSIAELLRDVRESTGGYLQNPTIRYRDENVTYRGDVLVDRYEIAAALANLVKNAIEALPAEGGDIDVSVAAEGKSVVFSVSDTGAGIKPEFLPLLFERSFTYGKDGGTGLGLSHVRAVAEKHGGRVYVESEVGRGTTIRIRLPDHSSYSDGGGPGDD
jgi:signal transduction histidine kinase